MAEFSFRITETCGSARIGILETANGCIETPYLVPVATLATVKSLDSSDLESIGAQCVLANTYHLYLRPGDSIVKKLGGLHKFMNLKVPIFTDSGGFQAFSLGYGMEHNINKLGGVFSGDKKAEEGKEKLARITEEGIIFKSVYDGSKHVLTPKKSMSIQSNLGSDIIMALDECTSPLSGYEYTERALVRTHRWAKESLRHHDRKQAIYGIIQGGYFRELRKKSSEFISSLPFEGIAIGGALGKSKKDMHEILDWIVPMLNDRPRHLLGIGEVDDLFECVERGIDTFDCVAPTRLARRGGLYIRPESGGKISNKFRINIDNQTFREDKEPIDKKCKCMTCRKYSRAYLRHLYAANELAYFRLATIHNLSFMLTLMKELRESIRGKTFSKLKKKWL